MDSRRRILGCSVALLLAAPALSLASGLGSLIPGLFSHDIILAPPPPGFPSHETHFHDQDDRLRNSGLQINSSIVSQLSTFPISSSAGGFTYVYDSSLGIFNRSSESFGPIFTERAQTLGHGKWNLGFNYLHSRYDSIDGLSLKKGDLSFPLQHQDVDHNGNLTDLFFEGDVIEARAFATITAETAVVFASYGVTDRFDVSVAVPTVRVKMDATAQLTVDRIATGASSPIHQFSGGSIQQTYSSSGSASGIGDVVLRGKYRLVSDASSGLAAAVDVRLPTGNDKDLLGSGSTQTKAFLIGSQAWGKVALHGNLGYTFSSGSSATVGKVANEINYGLAFDAVLHPRLTLAAEVIGRILRDGTRLVEGNETLSYTTQGDPTIKTVQRPGLTFKKGDINLVEASLGLRYNPAGTFLINLDVLKSVNNDGLHDSNLVPFVGIDYSF